MCLTMQQNRTQKNCAVLCGHLSRRSGQPLPWVLITGLLSYCLYTRLNLFADRGKSSGSSLRLNELRLVVMIFKVAQEVPTLFPPSDQPSLSLSFALTEYVSLL